MWSCGQAPPCYGIAGDRSKAFHKGDVLVFVNGITLAGKTPDDVKSILMQVWCAVDAHGPCLKAL